MGVARCKRSDIIKIFTLLAEFINISNKLEEIEEEVVHLQQEHLSVKSNITLVIFQLFLPFTSIPFTYFDNLKIGL
jgi:hypothetical protein